MKIEFLPLSKRARLLEPLVIAGQLMRAGFIFNAANIPILLVPLIWLTRWHPKVRRGACIHDKWWSDGDRMPVAEARIAYRKGNAYFRDTIREDGCNRWQVFAAYNAVRVSGMVRLAKKKRRIAKQRGKI